MKKRDTRPPLYIVKSEQRDWIWGDNTSWHVRQIKRPLLNMPYPTRDISGAEDGAALAAQLNHRPIYLSDVIVRDPSGYVTYDVREVIS